MAATALDKAEFFHPSTEKLEGSMKMERFFVVIGRINSVLLLLVLIGAAAAIAFMTSESSRWQRRGAVEVSEGSAGTTKPILLSFERVERITGADVQMMRLTTQEKSTKFSSGGYGNETRNVLFLTGAEKVARWLFGDHKNLVLITAQLREESANTKEDLPTKAIYFEYVSNDTDGNGILSNADASNIGLAKPDGTGFVEVLKDVTRVFSYEMYDARHLSVVFQHGGAVRHAKFSIADFRIVSDQEIMKVPNTL